MAPGPASAPPVTVPPAEPPGSPPAVPPPADPPPAPAAVPPPALPAGPTTGVNLGFIRALGDKFVDGNCNEFNPVGFNRSDMASMPLQRPLLDADCMAARALYHT